MDVKDAVIVGAGPAGSSVAYFLAKSGLDVWLLESKKLPRSKPCGDGIGPRAVLILHQMGLADWLKEKNFYRLDRMRLISQSGRSIVSETSGHNFPIPYGYVIRREIFDYRLVQQAVAAGANFLPDFRAESCLSENGRSTGVSGNYKGNNAKIKARLVVVADGSTGSFSRQFNSNSVNSAAIAYRGYAHFTSELDRCANIYFSDRLPTGYGWVFPLSNRSANIGVGSLCLKNKGVDLKQAFLDFVTDTVSPLPLREAKIEAPRHGSIMRMNFGRRPLVLPGIAFVGDAAGLVSPISGEGISHAMESSRLLAEVIEGKLRDRKTVDAGLRQYDREMRRKFTSYFRWGRLLGRLLSSHDRLDRLISKAEKDAYLAHLLTGVLSNTIHPRELGRLHTITRILF